MKLNAKRLLGAGVLAVSAIVTPIALTVGLSGVASTPQVAGASAFDQIFFNQTTSSPADTFQYVPSSGATATTQAVNVSGNCASPTGGGAAILSVCGEVYANSTYAGTPKAASLGTNGPATGVGAVSPAWTIDNKVSSKTQAEAIDFAPGSNTAVIGSNRLFTDAQILIQRKDTGVAQNPSVAVNLVEFDSSRNVLATQNCTISGGQGTQITADTATDPACTGNPAPPTGFQTVEVQDLTPSSSISVVGPQAVFTLANSICGGQSINPVNNGGNVTATLTLTGPATQCKTYTSFSDSIDPQTGLPTLSFNGFSTSAVSFKVQITWPLQPECQPYTDATIPTDLTLPTCAPHQISVNGTNYYDQAYCQTASPSLPAGDEPQGGLCTTNKSYNNNDPVTGTPLVMPGNANPPVPATQISETWVGDIDMYWR